MRGSQHARLRLATIAALLGLAGFVLVVPVSGLLAWVTFVLAVSLALVLFARFGPGGDLWHVAEDLGVSPWLLVMGVLLAGTVIALARSALLHAG